MDLKTSTLFEIVEKHPETEEVFDQYDEKAGKCIMCHYLFTTPGQLSEEIDIDESKLLNEINLAIDRKLASK